MPCRVDEPTQPNEAERQSKYVAELLLYLHEEGVIPYTFVSTQIDKFPNIPKYMRLIECVAEDDFGDPTMLNDMTVLLCEVCRTLRDDYIGDTKSFMRRRLADWWVKHKEADDKRIEREKWEATRKELKNNALSKLTDEEKVALGLI